MYVTDVTSGVNKEYLSATTQFLDRFNKVVDRRNYSRDFPISPKKQR